MTRLTVEAITARARELADRLKPREYIDARSVPDVIEWQAAPVARETQPPPPTDEGLQLLEGDLQPVRVRQVWFHRCPLCGRAHHSVEQPSGPTRCQRCRQWLLAEPVL